MSDTQRGPAWDADQVAVIREPPSARILVRAGPGTGKTATACARIASLIERGIEPYNILLISFTRTAVAELRNRINQGLAGPSAGASVRISTVDAQAWHLRYGFDEGGVESLFGGFEPGIDAATALIAARNPLLLEFLSSLEHLVVDEAQDLTGSRQRFLVALITSLLPGCGVTVFGDSAQAIYGFADEDQASGVTGADAFLSTLEAGALGPFSAHELKTLHRTKDEALRLLFAAARSRLLASEPAGSERWSAVREEIQTYAASKAGPVEDEHLDNRSDMLVLFRRRVDVLIASSRLSSDNVRHRLRLSGLPAAIQPWLGWILSAVTQVRLSKEDYNALWAARFVAAIMTHVDRDEAWQTLIDLSRMNHRYLDLRAVRRILSRPEPPTSLRLADAGVHGPILGTIHASKGREASEVLLYLPERYSGDDDEAAAEEESRVLYVGATRAIKALRIGASLYTPASAAADIARVHRPLRGNFPRSQVEIGRAGDVDSVAAAGSAVASTCRAAENIQELLAGAVERPIRATAALIPSRGYVYEIETRHGAVGELSANVNRDLYAIARTHPGRVHSPGLIHHLYIYGATTVVLADTDERLADLHPPYANTGFLLAPLVKGFPVTQFRT